MRHRGAKVGALTLEPLRGKIRSKDFLILDLESKDGPSQNMGLTAPFLAGLYDGEKYEPCWNSPEMTDWQDYWKEGNAIDRAMRKILTRKYRGRYIVAHNGGRFDYLFVLPWLMHIGKKLGFQWSAVPVASSIQILDVWKTKKRADGRDQKHGEWRFIDSVKLMPAKLDDLAKTFLGEGKLEHDLNLPITERAAWESYNCQDCVALYRVMVKLQEHVQHEFGGELGVTAPSTSMKTFRRRFLHTSIHRTKRAHEFVRSGYYGGRCEKFQKEASSLYYYDVNSCYMYAMLEPMPVGPGVQWQGNHVPDHFLGDDYVGFVRAKVEVPATIPIPPLPLRIPKTSTIPDKLIFPTGRLAGVWEWSELQYAVSLGCHVEAIEESWWFAAERIFDDFVRTLYAYRDKSRPDFDAALDKIAKLLGNSNYGKWAMRTLREKIYMADDPSLPSGPNVRIRPAWTDPDRPACPILYVEEETDADYVIPQISARVTARARVRLHELMMVAVSRGGIVPYCDTDGFKTNVKLETSSALGGLKLEYPEYAGNITGVFLAPKLYYLEAPGVGDLPPLCSVKAKGFEERTKEVLDRLLGFDEQGNPNKIYSKKLEKIGTLARLGFTRGPLEHMVPRSLGHTLTKRIEHLDGSTSPYNLNLW